MMMFIHDFPKSNEQGKIASSLEQLKSEKNTGALRLKENKLNSPSPVWSTLAWCEFSGKASKHHFEMFDQIAQRIYEILDFRKLHSRLTTNNVLNVPKVNPKDFKQIDLQCPAGLCENLVPYNLFAALEKIQNTNATTKTEKTTRAQSTKGDAVQEIVDAAMKNLRVDYQKNQIPSEFQSMHEMELAPFKKSPPSKLFQTYLDAGMPDMWSRYKNYLKDRTFNASVTTKHLPQHWEGVLKRVLNVPVEYTCMESLEEYGLKAVSIYVAAYVRLIF